MLKIKGLLKFVALMGIGVSLLGAGSVTANASNKPYYGSFASRKITYHIDSTSKHWKDIWKGAIDSWNSLHVVKLRAIKKASKADIRLTTKKTIKGGVTYSYYLDGPQGSRGIFYSKIALNRQSLAELNETEQEVKQEALCGVGIVIGLKTNDDETSALSSYASKPSAQDKANLKAAYKGIK